MSRSWLFSISPLSRPAGSEGAFATMGAGRGNDYRADASLVSPAVDLTGQQGARLSSSTPLSSLSVDWQRRTERERWGDMVDHLGSPG